MALSFSSPILNWNSIQHFTLLLLLSSTINGYSPQVQNPAARAAVGIDHTRNNAPTWPVTEASFAVPVSIDGKHTLHVHFFKDVPLMRSVENFCGILGSCTEGNKEAIVKAAMAKGEDMKREGEVRFQLVTMNSAFEGSKVAISLFEVEAKGTMNVYGKVVNLMVRLKPHLDVSEAEVCYQFSYKSTGLSPHFGCVRLRDLKESRLLSGEMQLASSWLVVRGSVNPHPTGEDIVTRRLRLGIPDNLAVNEAAVLDVSLRLDGTTIRKASFEVVKRGPQACNSFFKTCDIASYSPFESCHVDKIDEMYEAFFGFQSNGVFVEMGSYDGHSWSNTAFLADIGWYGLYFDPIPEHVMMTEARHWENNVTVYETALGNETKEITIEVGGPITTADNDYSVKYQDGSIDWTPGFFQGDRRQVKQRLLPDLLRSFNIPRNFDLLIVDVEGMEYQILSTLNLSEFAPRMAIIELQDDHPSFESLGIKAEECRRIRKQFADHGYVELFRDEVNTVFARYD